MELVKIGDAAVSEQKVVDTSSMSSPNEDEKSTAEKKSTSSKKAKSKTQSRGTARPKIPKEQEKEISLFKENIFIVFVECETPGNIGFLARTMANFGLKNLVLINPPTLTNEAYYQATHGKYIVENAKIYPT